MYNLAIDRIVKFLIRVFTVKIEILTAMTMKNAIFWDIKLISYLTGNTLHLEE
jgi:hypothetical protein